MDTRRWRRQDGLIREALYIFLAIAIVMAVLLDGVAIMKVQQAARDLSGTAGEEARTAYTNSGDVNVAKAAAEQHVAGVDGAKMIGFSVTSNLTNTPTFTVTVKASTDTYVFKYLKYIPGLKGWVEQTQNPVYTTSTT